MGKRGVCTMSRRMNTSPFPEPARVSIDDRATIAAIEDLFTAVAGVIAATGGSFAIAGHDVRDTTPLQRARTLTAMYDAGEVVVGYADARSGDVVNIVIEHLLLNACSASDAPCWRALIYVEEPMGHELRGSLVAHDWRGLAAPLFDAITDGLRRPLPSARAALAALARGAA